MNEKKYRLRYKGQWMKPKHVLGTYVYELKDDIELIDLMSLQKATAWRSLISEDNNIIKDDIELVEF